MHLNPGTLRMRSGASGSAESWTRIVLSCAAYAMFIGSVYMVHVVGRRWVAGALLGEYVNGYNPSVIEIQRTEVFERWLRRLRDTQGRRRITDRIHRISSGNYGDTRSVGGGVSELRIHYGPGYRVYFTRMGESIIVLLAGGDKDSQQRDIRTAQDLARELR